MQKNAHSKPSTSIRNQYTTLYYLKRRFKKTATVLTYNHIQTKTQRDCNPEKMTKQDLVSSANLHSLKKNDLERIASNAYPCFFMKTDQGMILQAAKIHTFL